MILLGCSTVLDNLDNLRLRCSLRAVVFRLFTHSQWWRLDHIFQRAAVDNQRRPRGGSNKNIKKKVGGGRGTDTTFTQHIHILCLVLYGLTRARIYSYYSCKYYYARTCHTPSHTSSRVRQECAAPLFRRVHPSTPLLHPDEIADYLSSHSILITNKRMNVWCSQVQRQKRRAEGSTSQCI